MGKTLFTNAFKPTNLFGIEQFKFLRSCLKTLLLSLKATDSIASGATRREINQANRP
ncbi:MAG: hypothetical protein M3367_08725 [Acidobacteriota bacterium]|nr:hypothetical protein [Acidobacteriota bacterium]